MILTRCFRLLAPLAAALLLPGLALAQSAGNLNINVGDDLLNPVRQRAAAGTRRAVTHAGAVQLGLAAARRNAELLADFYKH